ncbi:hypothetical protein [Phenylobacterium sp. SCN 70-31]|uniref:hypothetical protein n=1 Tax=Phenylobacterium sp. SCN 70-31 TaxID=1660129 RepID=UPI00086F87E5|nr:hypothetical protein [Phenylobacterium sp. SCN 70-31]ODT88101.1 MAG: hypothetical protein ABS78_09420 [Phenylobacterium sp. SCN 70-31]
MRPYSPTPLDEPLAFRRQTPDAPPPYEPEPDEPEETALYAAMLEHASEERERRAEVMTQVAARMAARVADPQTPGRSKTDD